VADIRTEMVEFRSNGSTTPGFLARPEGDGPFPGVIVIQEWWGLNDNIKDIAQRFAREGYAAFAPDLYHGRVTKEPSQAQKMMMQLDMPLAAKELVKAAEYLASQKYINGRGIGAIGFCMGGGLAMTLACKSPLIKAVAPFYGFPPDPVDMVKSLNGPVFLVFAEHDDWISRPVRDKLQKALKDHSKHFEAKVYPGTHHAFFRDVDNDAHDPSASKDAWERTLKLFGENL
jgi:carboxymethylenebutenolidase